MTTSTRRDMTHQNRDETHGIRAGTLEFETDSLAKACWRKPNIVELSCGLEINCYATSTGSQRRR